MCVGPFIRTPYKQNFHDHKKRIDKIQFLDYIIVSCMYMKILNSDNKLPQPYIDDIGNREYVLRSLDICS